MNQLPKKVVLNIKVQFSLTAVQKLWYWTDLARGEFSALGEVESVLDSESGRLIALRIVDLHLVRQTCSDAETEMDIGAVAELLGQVDPNRLHCWVHSHGTLPVFWSPTDEDCIAGLSEGGWLLSLVVNRRHDSRLRLDQFHPAHLTVDDLAWETYIPMDDAFEQQVRKEFEEKVTEGVFRTLLDKSAISFTPLPIETIIPNQPTVYEEDWDLAEYDWGDNGKQ